MRKIPLVQGEFYHLYNRGVDKRVVFTESSEYRRFLAYLYMLNTHEDIRPSDFFRTHSIEESYEIERGEPLVGIGAYCLMPNHFHLYVTPLVENGVSKFMQRLETAYTKYFNEKHKRTGSLFGSTFKSEHVGSDQQAKYLFSYIHLNPAKLKDYKWKERGSRDWRSLKKFVIDYSYSSLAEYISGQHLITSLSKFPQYLKSKKDIDVHISDWLHYRHLREAKHHAD